MDMPGLNGYAYVHNTGPWLTVHTLQHFCTQTQPELQLQQPKTATLFSTCMVSKVE